MTRRRVFKLWSICLVALMAAFVVTLPASAAGSPWTANLSGVPSTPQHFCANDGTAAANGINFDCVFHDRAPSTIPPAMDAGHGPACEAPPATHPVLLWPDEVFLCNNHVMTATRSGAGGYGETVIVPNELVDISGGVTAQVKYTVSTLRTSMRDWYDLYFTPFGENLVLPIETFLPDLQGGPKDGFHLKLDLSCDTRQGSRLLSQEIVDFVETSIDTGNQSCTALEYLAGGPSSAVQSPFEIDFSSTHLKVTMVCGATVPGPATCPTGTVYTIFDHDFPTVLSSTQYVMQITHHSYSPEKACTPGAGYLGELTCGPNTWHWGKGATVNGIVYPGLYISSAVPFTLNKGNVDEWIAPVSGQTAQVTITLGAPTAANAFLRFAAIGTGTYSVDGGATFQPLTLQQQSPPPYNGDGKLFYENYWTAIPAGVSSVIIKLSPWSSHAGQTVALADATVWSQ